MTMYGYICIHIKIYLYLMGENDKKHGHANITWLSSKFVNWLYSSNCS